MCHCSILHLYSFMRWILLTAHPPTTKNTPYLYTSVDGTNSRIVAPLTSATYRQGRSKITFFLKMIVCEIGIINGINHKGEDQPTSQFSNQKNNIYYIWSRHFKNYKRERFILPGMGWFERAEKRRALVKWFYEKITTIIIINTRPHNILYNVTLHSQISTSMSL